MNSRLILPDLVLEHIFGSVIPTAVPVCQLVCRQWNSLIQRSIFRLPKIHVRRINFVVNSFADSQSTIDVYIRTQNDGGVVWKQFRATQASSEELFHFVKHLRCQAVMLDNPTDDLLRILSADYIRLMPASVELLFRTHICSEAAIAQFVCEQHASLQRLFIQCFNGQAISERVVANAPYLQDVYLRLGRSLEVGATSSFRLHVALQDAALVSLQRVALTNYRLSLEELEALVTDWSADKRAQTMQLSANLPFLAENLMVRVADFGHRLHQDPDTGCPFIQHPTGRHRFLFDIYRVDNEPPVVGVIIMNGGKVL